MVPRGGVLWHSGGVIDLRARRLVVAPIAWAALAALALPTVGCGGSSSETPWPVEPVNAEMGPAGESSARAAANEAEPAATATPQAAPRRVPSSKPKR